MKILMTALTKVCQVCGGTYSYDEAHSCTQGNTKLFAEEQPAPLLDPEALIGATLGGRYHIEGCLEGGGMGVVYRGRQLVLDRPVAIKIMVMRHPQEEAARQRFLQEAVLASRIHHSNVVDMFDFGVLDGGHLYLVMEFLEGQTLRKVMAGGPLPPLRSCRIAAQIARGLQSVHDEGIVHRDLKPDNVFLVQRDGQPDFVKIVDFGVAKGKSSPNLTQAGMVLGTPQYMAPEQVDGGEPDNRPDHRIDQYALGCVLYRMLTGLLPFDGDSASDILLKHATEAVIPPRRRRPDLGIPVSLEAVVLRAMAKRPENRYPSLRDMERALLRESDILQGKPEVSDATREFALPTPSQTMGEVARGRLILFMGLGAGVVLLMMLVTSWLLEQAQRRQAGPLIATHTTASNTESQVPVASTAAPAPPAAAARVMERQAVAVASGPLCAVEEGSGLAGAALTEGTDADSGSLWRALAPSGGESPWNEVRAPAPKEATQPAKKEPARGPAKKPPGPAARGEAPHPVQAAPAMQRPRQVGTKVVFVVENREDVKVVMTCTGRPTLPCTGRCALEVPEGKGTCIATAPGSGYQPLSLSFDELRARLRANPRSGGSFIQPLSLKYIKYQ